MEASQTVSSPETWEAALDQVLAEMRTIMIERQNKYGPQNIRDQGLYGVITRAVADKVARITTALNGRLVKGRVVLDPIVDSEAQDTFEDGLFDAANYLGPIALMVYRGWWDLPREAVTADVTVPTVQGPEQWVDLPSFMVGASTESGANAAHRNGLVLPPTASSSSAASNAAASSARVSYCRCDLSGCDSHGHYQLNSDPVRCDAHLHGTRAL